LAVTRKDVEHVARLARLELGEDEIQRFERELAKIVEYVNELSSVDTEGVLPTTSVAVEAAPLRPDEHVRGLERDVVLAQAPRTAEGSFAVPAFIDET
jgi:aspartyl-tRNA(Asn)/glutamyl-tRNA(Gln) amidotransferase subunit C